MKKSNSKKSCSAISHRAQGIYIYMECSHLLKHSEKPDQSVRIPAILKLCGLEDE